MKVNPITPSFKQAIVIPSNNKKEGFLEKFHTAAKNSADMTDTILVPRTIFKGYLGIMAGTMLMHAGGFLRYKIVKDSLYFSLFCLFAFFY